MYEEALEGVRSETCSSASWKRERDTRESATKRERAVYRRALQARSGSKSCGGASSASSRTAPSSTRSGTTTTDRRIPEPRTYIPSRSPFTSRGAPRLPRARLTRRVATLRRVSALSLSRRDTRHTRPRSAGRAGRRGGARPASACEGRTKDMGCIFRDISLVFCRDPRGPSSRFSFSRTKGPPFPVFAGSRERL